MNGQRVQPCIGWARVSVLFVVLGVSWMAGCVRKESRDVLIEKKLSSTIVPGVHWRNIRVWMALGILERNLRAVDVGDGVPLEVIMPARDAMPDANAVMKCHADNISILEAAKMIAGLTGRKVAITNGCVVFSPK